MSLPLQVRSYLTPLYSQALSAIYQFYDQTRDPSYALAQDVDIYEIMLRDAKIFQGVQERLLSVAGPNWRVFSFNNSKDPADLALAKFCDDALRFAPHLVDMRQRSATSIFRGQSCELMSGKRRMLRLGPDKAARNWWMFTEFKNIDPRRFTYRNVQTRREDGTTRINTELWMSTVPMWQGSAPAIRGIDYDNRTDKSKVSVATPPSSLMSYGYRPADKYIPFFCRVVYNDEEARLGYGRGLVDCLYFYHWIKQVLLREGLQGVERWSQGIVVGTIDETLLGTPDTQTTSALQTAMMNALQNMRSRHVYVQSKQDDVKVIEGGGEGHQMVMSFIEYIDDCIMAVCTGAVLMSSKSAAGDAGSHARDEQGAKTQNKVIIADQLKIDEDQSTQILGLWVRQNWQLLGKVGFELGLDLQHARPPQIKTIPPKEINPTDAANRYAAIWGANPRIKFRMDDFYENLGETPVNTDEDEFVQGADPAAVASSAGNPGNDPSQMMMEGSSQQPNPTPAGVSMRARAGMTPEAMERLIERKVDEQVSARMRLMTEPKRDEHPTVVFNNAHLVPDKTTEKTLINTFTDVGDKIVRATEEIRTIKDSIPTPIVNVPPPTIQVNVPKQQTPIVNFQAAPTQVTVQDKSAGALGRIADALEAVFGWMIRKKATKKVEFDRDKDGRITGATVNSKD